MADHSDLREDGAGSPEVELLGGNISTVVRVGGTVRRSAGFWTPAVHALLRHLKEEGFSGAPRALGIDRKGREALSYLEGDVFPYPMPDFVWSETALVAVARLLRNYHDRVTGFQPPADLYWQVQEGAPSRGPLICHNDIAPYNTVFLHERPAGFIDWDLAAPATALYDIAHAVWHYVPLYDSPDTPISDKPQRLRGFCDAYGLEDRSQLLPTIRRRMEASCRTLQVWGTAGRTGWAEMWRTGHAEGKLESITWVDQHWRELEAALGPNRS